MRKFRRKNTEESLILIKFQYSWDVEVIPTMKESGKGSIVNILQLMGLLAERLVIQIRSTL
ncbi:hypothetical protein M3182_12810 [Mesobacillus maritimus]|uniref:hypothetical protein n=1 Tax=Mesobacillus maritimus TaxID=1643336 RepID=UPI00203A92E1|nr:hypothetical protein [Mesobacillus maritimus]MCM3586613.1 hypothetical protein [Mesobacillus maritimus]MCM3668633.1 hypothetical protein [Mesobacillus maritimus]